MVLISKNKYKELLKLSSEDRWNEIRIAEKNTKEGNKKFNELKEEFVETFWKDGVPLPDFHDLHASFN